MANNPNYRTGAVGLLEGLARALEAVPSDQLTSDSKERKQDLILGLREAVEDTWSKTAIQGEDLQNVLAYSATEYRNEILFSLFSQDEVVNILHK